jgi:hypothetical protein
MMGLLKERGIPFLTGKEAKITADDLRHIA